MDTGWAWLWCCLRAVPFGTVPRSALCHSPSSDPIAPAHTRAHPPSLQACQECVEQCVAKLGKLDILVGVGLRTRGIATHLGIVGLFLDAVA